MKLLRRVAAVGLLVASVAAAQTTNVLLVMEASSQAGDEDISFIIGVRGSALLCESNHRRTRIQALNFRPNKQRKEHVFLVTINQLGQGNSDLKTAGFEVFIGPKVRRTWNNLV